MFVAALFATRMDRNGTDESNLERSAKVVRRDALLQPWCGVGLGTHGEKGKKGPKGVLRIKEGFSSGSKFPLLPFESFHLER